MRVRIGLLTLLAALIPMTVQATDVSGNVAGVWDLAGSPYMVMGDVKVPSDEVLEIHPGVQVLFTGPYALHVKGQLLAIGEETDSIVFAPTTNNDSERWKGIRLDTATAVSRLVYCRVEGARWPNDAYNTSGGGIQSETSSITVEHTLIRLNASARNGSGICGYNSIVRIYDSEVVGNVASYGGGVTIGGPQGDLLMVRCIVKQNQAGQGGGVANWGAPHATLIGCTIEGNHGDDGGGIRAVGAGVSISNTIIADNTNFAVTVWEVPSGTSIAYCDIWNNSLGGNSPYPSHTGVRDRTNANADSCDQYQNIFLDPLFADAANDNFSLQSTSPCINAGDPDSPHDPDGTRADIGAIPYMHGVVLSPSVLDFGILDLGADSSMTAVMANGGSSPLIISTVLHNLPEFAVDTAGLHGVVQPHDSYAFRIRFSPSTRGSYFDTLKITATQPDSVFTVVLSGHADILLPQVESLVIARGTGNTMQLSWAPITHTMSGRPYSPPYYIIYGATTPNGSYVPIDMSPVNSYTHAQFSLQPIYFYRVTAGTDEGRRINELRGKEEGQ